MDFSNVSSVLIIISTSLALAGVFFKGSNDFFLNTIKMKYNSVPGQKSVFSMVVTMVVVLVCFLDIPYVAIKICLWLTDNCKTDSSFTDNSIANILLLIWCVTFLYSFLCSLRLVFHLRPRYIDKLEKEEYKKIKKSAKVFNRISLFFSIYIMGFVIFIFGCVVKYSTVTEENIFTCGAIIIIGIVTYCIGYNEKEIINEINSNDKYKLSISSYDISCRLYLDMGEYYLLFIEGEETYIRKTEVKRISKIKGEL